MNRSSLRRTIALALALCGALTLVSGASLAVKPLQNPRLEPLGPATVGVPFKRFYLFVAACSRPPCTIFQDLQTVSARGHNLPRILRAGSGNLTDNFASNPSAHHFYSTWYSASELDIPAAVAAIRRYGSIQIRNVESITDATGRSSSAARTITLVLKEALTKEHVCTVAASQTAIHAVGVRTNVGCPAAETLRARVEGELASNGGAAAPSAILAGYAVTCKTSRLAAGAVEERCAGEGANVAIAFSSATPTGTHAPAAFMRRARRPR